MEQSHVEAATKNLKQTITFATIVIVVAKPEVTPLALNKI